MTLREDPENRIDIDRDKPFLRATCKEVYGKWATLVLLACKPFPGRWSLRLVSSLGAFEIFGPSSFDLIDIHLGWAMHLLLSKVYTWLMNLLGGGGDTCLASI